MWGAEAELPPDAEAQLQHSKRVGARLPLPQAGEGLWSAEAELPPDAEAALQHSKRVGYECSHHRRVIASTAR
jgi:hypothetical protein